MQSTWLFFLQNIPLYGQAVDICTIFPISPNIRAKFGGMWESLDPTELSNVRVWAGTIYSVFKIFFKNYSKNLYDVVCLTFFFPKSDFFVIKIFVVKGEFI